MTDLNRGEPSDAGRSLEVSPPDYQSRRDPLDFAEDFDYEPPPMYEPPKPAPAAVPAISPATTSVSLVEMTAEWNEARNRAAGEHAESVAMKNYYKARQSGRSYYACLWLAIMFTVLCSIVAGRASSGLDGNDVTAIWTQTQVGLVGIIPFFHLLPVIGLLVTLIRRDPSTPKLILTNRAFAVFYAATCLISVGIPAVTFLMIVASLATHPLPGLGPMEYATAGAVCLGMLLEHAIWQMYDNNLSMLMGVPRELFCGSCCGIWKRESSEGDAERMRMARQRARRFGFVV